MFKKEDNSLKNSESKKKQQITIYLEAKDVDRLKALSKVKDISLNSVIVNLVLEGLEQDKNQSTINAYQQFKDSLQWLIWFTIRYFSNSQ